MCFRLRGSGSFWTRILARASLALSCIAVVGSAQGEDGRKQVHLTGFPWSAVGKVHTEGLGKGRECTGVLIAPDRVLTAGHCVDGRQIGTTVPIGAVKFQPGLDGAGSVAAAEARCLVRFGPNPRLKSAGLLAFHRDAAVIVLSRPLEGAHLALARDESVGANAKVSHAGYGLDHGETLSLHENCRVIWNAGLLAASSCTTAGGQSGGPVLVEEDGTARLAGIMVGKTSPELSYFVPVQSLRRLPL